MKKAKILVIIGTRPELIKLAVLIKLFEQSSWVDLKVLITAQHRDLLDQMLEAHGISCNIDLNIMQENQDLTSLTGNLFLKMGKVIKEISPDIIFAQGDTTTVMVASVIAFYMNIKFAHIEAGLRSYDFQHPFPEEFNRVTTGLIADFHFVPTEQDKANLIKDKIEENKIFVVGNTVIDNLLKTSEEDVDVNIDTHENKKLILVTLHRRENFGKPLENICRAICEVVNENQDTYVIYPVHPNPNVQNIVKQTLQNQDRIILCNPLNYKEFVSLMKRSYLIITDSGGIQEEAPALGKPVLITRNKTERTEAVKEGVSKLIGTDYYQIKKELLKLLKDQKEYKKMSVVKHIYGDGKASKRIHSIIYDYYSNKI